jgi:hypothetical protein
MKKEELRQLIREELKNALSEKKYVIWKGSRVEVVKDDGGPTLTVIKPDGREGMVFRKDTSLPLKESLNSLIDNKDNIADTISKSNIPDEEFKPYTKMGAVNFIKRGNPSKEYLKDMMNILTNNNIKIELPQSTPLPDRNIEDIEDFNAILAKYLK